MLRESSASEISFTDSAVDSATSLALGLGEADMVDESDRLGSEECSVELRSGR